MPFFKSAPKSPQEVIKAMRDAIQVLSTEEAGKKSEKVFSDSRHWSTEMFEASHLCRTPVLIKYRIHI